MDGNGGKGLLFTKMSPDFDNWRQEAQCSSTHSKSMQPCWCDEYNLPLEKPMSMESTLNDYLTLNASILESVCLALLLGLQDTAVTCGKTKLNSCQGINIYNDGILCHGASGNRTPGILLLRRLKIHLSSWKLLVP